jgi:hypothetical protein
MHVLGHKFRLAAFGSLTQQMQGDAGARAPRSDNPGEGKKQREFDDSRAGVEIQTIRERRPFRLIGHFYGV